MLVTATPGKPNGERLPCCVADSDASGPAGLPDHEGVSTTLSPTHVVYVGLRVACGGRSLPFVPFSSATVGGRALVGTMLGSRMRGSVCSSHEGGFLAFWIHRHCACGLMFSCVFSETGNAVIWLQRETVI